MRYRLLVIFGVLTILFNIPNSSFAGEPQTGLQVAQADLSQKVIQRMEKVGQAIDGFQSTMEMDLAPEKRLTYLKQNLDTAQFEYDKIHEYYGGKFDPNHPDFVALTARLEATQARYTATEANKGVVPPAESASTGQATTTQATTTQAATTQTAGLQPLSSPGASRARAALEGADQSIAVMDDWFGKAGFSPEVRWRQAQEAFNGALAAHGALQADYQGEFDLQDPDYLAFQSRLSSARDRVEGFFSREVAAALGIDVAVPAAGSTDPLPGTADGLYVDMTRLDGTIAGMLESARLGISNDYVQRGGVAERDGATLKQQEGILENDFAALSAGGRFDPGWRDFQALNRRVEVARTAAQQFYEFHGLYGFPPSLALLKAMEPSWHYPDQGMTSKTHELNAGGIVWSKAVIGFNSQDQAVLESNFALSDPIFGRVYLERALRNTAVFSSVDNKPQENLGNSYEIRLFIDDQEVAVSFGKFMDANLEEDSAKTWTTFQFSPNAMTDDAYDIDVQKKWEKATRGLATGSHRVRFEIWAISGQFRSREPIAVGTFRLTKGEGEALALSDRFPADSFGGTDDVDALRAQMRAALLASSLAKSDGEILDISVTSDWQYGVYVVTEQRFRKVNGTVLWHDTNGDGVCRFLGYKFVSDHAGGQNWTALRSKAFCNGCKEGEVRCPQ